MNLVIFADDFTGAIDTGIQFSQLGIATGYYIHEDSFKIALQMNMQEVYIFNTNTRHLTDEMAYNKLYQLASLAYESNVDGILKKTDSALRGNIGSELAALMDSTKKNKLYFIPAYPKMNRITRKGIHYINGIMVHESVFGRDPFEPVMTSNVKKLCNYSKYKGCNMTYEELVEGKLPEDEIVIFDAKTKEDIGCIVTKLIEKEWINKDNMFLTAGCAGIAEVLAEWLPFKKQIKTSIDIYSGFIVICGSVNEITQKQVLYAKNNGFYEESLNIDEYLNQLDECNGNKTKKWNWLEEIKRKCLIGKSCIIDTGFPDKEHINDYAYKNKCSVKELGYRISRMLGDILCHLAKDQLKTILMIIGGDTLQGFVTMLGCDEIILHSELFPGVVLCSVKWQGYKQLVITKSGGFGDEDLLVVLEKWIKNEKRSIT